MLPHSVITVSIVTALLPQLARIAHEGRFDVMREQVSWALRVTTSLLFPAAVTLLVLGVPVAVLLFGYGSVTEEGARLLGLTLAGFALGLPAFSAYYVILRGFYALSDTRTPMVNAGVLNGANIVLAYALFMVVPVDLRVPWLAVAYSLSYWLALALLAARLRRRIGGLEGYRVVRTTVRVAIATALAGGLMAVVLRAYLDGQPPTSASEAAIAFGLAVVPGALVFLGAARAMHIREVNQVLQLAGRR
jgi:putative peptidoglycan lipid II flippase